MAVALSSTKIERVKIVDDNAGARRTIAFTVADANYKPVEELGPLMNLDDFIEASIRTVDAIVCDHRLTTYARFSGAEAVARFYQRRFPALLCTAWSRADIDAMRCYRRYIPSVINPRDLDPQAIVEGFKHCVQEINGNFLPSRRPWRTLVRVVEVDSDSSDKTFCVVLPAWNSSEIIRLPLNLLPAELCSHIQVGNRFFAQVNIGAYDQNDLYFDGFDFS
jgi:hypothetical protein